MDSLGEAAAFSSSLKQSSPEDLDIKTTMAEGTRRPLPFRHEGALFPFGVMYLKEKLYFTSALSSHRQASAVHTGKSACEGNTYAGAHIGVADACSPASRFSAALLEGGVTAAVSTGREETFLNRHTFT